MTVPKRHDDQATMLRALVDARLPRATSIAVTSGKGGVGKSSIAANLGVALAQRGLKVTILDLDLGLANLDVLLGLDARRNLSHLIGGAASMEDLVLEGPAGLKVVPGASGLEHLANLAEFDRQRLLLELRALEGDSDILILDLGAGVGKNVITFARHADTTLVLTTPEPTALADAYATIKLLSVGQVMTEIELLVNQADSRKEARDVYDRIAGVAGRFLGLPVIWAGYVLSDDCVHEAVRRRQPVVLSAPGCHASACIRALARKYAGQTAPPKDKEGFFARVAQMFR